MTATTYSRWRDFAWPAGIVILLLVASGVSWIVAAGWWPVIARQLGQSSPPLASEATGHGVGGVPTMDHVVISPQAQRNIGLRLGQIERRDFDRSIALPAIIAEQPGRSHIIVTTHFTGIVTKLHVAQGQAATAGQPLFDLRLTHEELIQSQTELLKTAQEMEILDREIARIEQLAREGGIAAKTLLDRKYERQRHEASFIAQKQALLLHEMSEDQIAEVLKTKQLIGSLTITALADEGMVEEPAAIVLQVHELKVNLGQHIMAGDTLAVLSDHARLLVEGEAFEQDAPALARALEHGWPLTLVPAIAASGPQTAPEHRQSDSIERVKLLYLADAIDPASRTFHFYAELPNQLVLDRKGPDGRRYVQWKYRPGERLRVQAPVERWPSRLVVPLEAVAHDGVEAFVFRYLGGEFVRTPIQVEHRDEQFAVLADDNTLREGQVIAMTAAQQVQFALANQAGSDVDLHPGHTH